jgi:pantoate--beta-alanine ligase
MGAFHEGHLELMRAAKRECDLAAVSLFVNPTQFGPAEDFERYPRHEERDFALAESIGVDYMFAPTVDEMYRGSETRVLVKGTSERWEGESRPGHFEGVATVVCKLFQIVRPDVAYFGLKDFQQCAVIRQMVSDLGMGIELRFLETVREPDGLAMSSRNRYLGPELRGQSPELYRALVDAARQIQASVDAPVSPVRGILDSAKSRLTAMGFMVDYFCLVSGKTLEPLERWQPGCRLIAAAKLGPVRLIDNCAVDPNV